jgi:hypothetical protein
MTPEDVPAAITADSLFPWLTAIAPPVEPVPTLAAPKTAERPRPADSQPLRPAA